MLVRVCAALAVVTCLTSSSFAASADKAQPSLRDQEQAACYDDAQKLCGEFVPDEQKIATCMRSKISQVSEGCKKFFH